MRRLATLLVMTVSLAFAGIAAAGEASTRIVGPDATNLTQGEAQAQWPFATVVYPGTTYLCGGSVIAPRWVLSAAHCGFDGGTRITNFPLYAGAYDRSALPAAMAADAALVHPSYNAATDEWDFLLLRLPAPTSATPAALPAPTDDAAITAAQAAGSAGSRNAEIAGWGLTTCTPVGAFPNQDCAGSPTDVTSRFLRSITGGIPLRVDADCTAPYGAGFSGATMLCAGNSPGTNPSSRNDTCGGDSGGPLMSTINGRRMLVGATSWGYLCGQPNFPGVYARVTAARAWICDTVTSPTSITAVATGSTSASVTWVPDTTTCPWNNPTVQVTANPGGISASAALSSGGVTLGGLAAGTTYSVSARVTSSGATPPAATASLSLPQAPSPVPDVPTPATTPPCAKTFFQQDARTARTQKAPDGTSAVRVVSRLRIYEDAQAWCRVDLTFIFRNRTTGARLAQLPGSTLGFRTLTGKDFSAPVVAWPTAREFRFQGSDPTGLNRRDARLVLVSYLGKAASMPAQSNIELMVVRRVPRDPAQASSAANPLFAQKNVFGTGVGWATVS